MFAVEVDNALCEPRWPRWIVVNIHVPEVTADGAWLGDGADWMLQSATAVLTPEDVELEDLGQAFWTMCHSSVVRWLQFP